MVDITITKGTELSADTLFYPPDLASGLKGSKASDWIDNQMPISRYEAILKARKAGQPLFDSIRWEHIDTNIPHYENGSGPQQYPTTATLQPGQAAPSPQYPTQSSTQSPNSFNDFIKENWKWLLPITIGVAIILTRR